MKKNKAHPYLTSLFGIFVCTVFSPAILATSVSGQGTWETTLKSRDLDGNPATVEAYYDTTLDITWLAQTSSGIGSLDQASAIAWAAGLDINGIKGWRLPANTPVNGSTYVLSLSNDGSTDWGYAATTTDGTDGGWRDASGKPVSEMGHMFYVTLGNRGMCDPAVPFPACSIQPGSGLTNTGPFSFSDLTTHIFWSSVATDPMTGLGFSFNDGERALANPTLNIWEAWAVHDGDVSAVPAPATLWLFSSGLALWAGVRRRC